MASVPVEDVQLDDVATCDGEYWIVVGVSAHRYADRAVRLAKGRTDPGHWVPLADVTDVSRAVR